MKAKSSDSSRYAPRGERSPPTSPKKMGRFEQQTAFLGVSVFDVGHGIPHHPRQWLARSGGLPLRILRQPLFYKYN